MWGAIFVAVIVYQLRHRYFLQATGAILLTGLLIYGVVVIFRDGLRGRQMRARRRVDGWVAPRSPAVNVLIGVCVAASFTGWMLPHNWYIQEGTVGSSEVLQRHEWWRLASSAFLHANYMHLYMNMFALWFLGREIDSQLGTTRFIVIYLAAALGGGLMVVAAGQEHTLGASGAIYGLMGATCYFGFGALRRGHKAFAKRMLFAAGALISINLLFTFSIPNISMASHIGGLITGFLVAMALGIPAKLNDAWALSDRCPKDALFTYDMNARRFSYHGPVGFARESHFVDAVAVATTKEAGWSPSVDVADLDPRAPIDCYVEDPYPLLEASSNLGGTAG
jgi:membrane associated rhomboid family serine protease